MGNVSTVINQMPIAPNTSHSFNSPQTSMQKHSPDASISEQADLIGRYSIKALINDWNSMPFVKIPKHWTMIRTNGGVLLGYYGDTFKSETRSILVRNDMTTEASV